MRTRATTLLPVLVSILAGILLSPFAALVIVGMPRLIHFVPPTQPLSGPGFVGALGAGLTVVIWNFGGWENLSVVSGELEDPKRNYLRAIAVALQAPAANAANPRARAPGRHADRLRGSETQSSQCAAGPRQCHL